jgi:hypothetical protein
MTLQEAYEKMRAYFSQPGARLARLGKGSTCEYITKDGRQCAVGCLIDQTWLVDNADVNAIGSLACFFEPEEHDDSELAEEFLEQLGMTRDDKDSRLVGFLHTAQSAHDSDADDAADFVKHLDTIAVSYGLKLVAA